MAIRGFQTNRSSAFPEGPATALVRGCLRVGMADGIRYEIAMKPLISQRVRRDLAILARYVERLVGERSAG